MKILSRFVSLSVFFILIDVTLLFSLDGTTIFKNADMYKSHEWTCNHWNARSLNANGNYRDNNTIYPFYPKGEPLGPELENISTGRFTGIPYALGLRDNVDLFEYKLKGGPLAVPTKEPILAGEIDRVNSSKYTGLDCSGFITNCLGFPDLRKNNSYTLWHPGTNHLMVEQFTDEIEWADLQTGDVLIRGKFESVSGHVGVVTSSSHDPETRFVNAIDASPNIKKLKNVAVSADPGVRACSFTWVSGNRKDNYVIKRVEDGGVGYKPRRFTPPYVRKVTVYREKIVKGVVEDYDLVYSREWGKKEDSNDIELKSNISSDAVYSGKLLFVIIVK